MKLRNARVFFNGLAYPIDRRRARHAHPVLSLQQCEKKIANFRQVLVLLKTVSLWK
jgi:hypothetical protein